MFKKCYVFFICFFWIISVFSSAVEQGKKVVKITTNSVEARGYYNKALFARYQAFEKGAVENFDKAIKADPCFVMARAFYSIFLSAPENQKMINEAKKCFDKVTEGERSFTLAMEASINNDNEKEIKLFEELLAKYPDDGAMHFELAGLYQTLNLIDKAIQQYKKTIICNPDIHAAYNYLAGCYIRIEEFEEAKKCLEKYAKFLPDDANPWDSLGEINKTIGNYSEAWKYFEKAHEINPLFTFALIHLGDVKHELGYYGKAVPYYQDGLKTLLPEKEISPSHYKGADSFWRLRLANNYLQMGKLEEAEREVKTILQHNVNFGNVLGHYLAAEIALRKGNIEKAKEEADLVQKFEKEGNFFNQEKDQIVNFIRGKIAFVEEDFALSEKFLITAINTFAKEGEVNMLSMIYPLGSERRISVELFYLLADVKRKQDMLAEEIEVLKRSLRLIPHQPQLRYRLGEIYSSQNRTDESIKEFKEFLNLSEEFKCNEEIKRKAERFIKNL